MLLPTPPPPPPLPSPLSGTCGMCCTNSVVKLEHCYDIVASIVVGSVAIATLHFLLYVVQNHTVAISVLFLLLLYFTIFFSSSLCFFFIFFGFSIVLHRCCMRDLLNKKKEKIEGKIFVFCCLFSFCCFLVCINMYIFI